MVDFARYYAFANRTFEYFILFCIVVVGMLTGLDTEYSGSSRGYDVFSTVLTEITNVIFIVEVILKLVATGGNFGDGFSYIYRVVRGKPHPPYQTPGWARFFFPNAVASKRAHALQLFLELDKNKSNTIEFKEIAKLLRKLGNKGVRKDGEYEPKKLLNLPAKEDEDLSPVNRELKSLAQRMSQKVLHVVGSRLCVIK